MKSHLTPNKLDLDLSNQKASFQNILMFGMVFTVVIFEVEHHLDLCVFAKNSPHFMRKSFSKTCAIFDLWVVLPPFTKFFDS